MPDESRSAFEPPWPSTVRLRPVRGDDVDWLVAQATDRHLVGRHNWPGEAPDPAGLAERYRAELAADGMMNPEIGRLVVELADGTVIGNVTWRPERWGPSPQSTGLAFGIALLPAYRGHGHGTVAQRLLIDHLFRTSPGLHRIQSDTAVDNPAEQRSLTKAGMVEEGRLRQGEWRDGAYHDHYVYGILRVEWEAWPEHGDEPGVAGE